jgi:hypothetical protein
MTRLHVNIPITLVDEIADVLLDRTAREAVPVLAEAIATLCLRAGLDKMARLHLAQLAMEVVTERLDAAGIFGGEENAAFG